MATSFRTIPTGHVDESKTNIFSDGPTSGSVIWGIEIPPSDVHDSDSDSRSASIAQLSTNDALYSADSQLGTSKAWSHLSKEHTRLVFASLGGKFAG